MSEWITILCALIGSGASAAIVNGLFAMRTEKKRKDTGESQGMLWLLQDRLEQKARQYLDEEYISYDDFKNWNKGHKIYHELLGGNGDLNTLREQLHHLYLKGVPRHDDEE